jgi:TPR repeat protein
LNHAVIPKEALEAFERNDYERVLSRAIPHAIEGNSDAQTTIALHYQCGPGVSRDVLEAERWLRVAAEQGNAVAGNNFGTPFALKIPKFRHRSEDAQEYYEKASRLGLKVAEPYSPASI